jgi:two-component system NtrC family sensor kinase
MASASPAEALEELALWLGAGTAELILESTVPGTGRIADWRCARPPAGARRRLGRAVRGEPEWRLLVEGLETAPSAELVDRGVVALEAWREAQLERVRSEARIEARARELDVLQALGRRAAEARNLPGLFASAVETLQQGGGLDLVLAAYATDGSPEAQAFFTRPFDSGVPARLVERAARLLGWPAGRRPRLRRVELPQYDPARGLRADVSDEDVEELSILRGDAVAAYLLVVPSPGADEAGKRLLYAAVNQLCVHVDRILTVREAEADRFRATLDSMPQAVLLADPALRIVQLNRSARDLFARLGLRTDGGLPAAFDTIEIGDLVRQVAEGRTRQAAGEVVIGTDRMLSATVTPLAGGDHGEPSLVVVLSDVTESRRLQQQLAHSEKMSSLGQMISGIAHELNNPLTSILGYSQLLGSTRDPATIAKRVEVLAREAGRCQKIVQNLLSFARRRRPEREPLSLNQVVQSVQALLAYQLRVENVAVSPSLDPALPMIHGDPHELQQVLVNLITNAQQAIRRGGDGGEIALTTSVADGGTVVLEVRDSGPGIPEPIREKIFDPFFTTKEEGKGTGLGLSLVYGIIESHGGSIEVVPGGGPGACFRITLPSGVPPAAAATAEREPAPLPSGPGTVLVVDDEPELARLICETLAEDGHHVESASDGNAALARVRERPFDLIVSDLHMPGMGGERLYEELRRVRPELGRRLLLISGDTVGDAPEAVAERTGLPLLHKPFDVEGLRRVVRERLALGSSTPRGVTDGED